MREEMLHIELFIYYFIAINLATFIAFGWDKSLAERGAWRVSEGNLLGLALLGGTPGAYAGRALFRHKTRKQPFCQTLRSIATLHLIFVGFAIVFVIASANGALR